MTITTLPPNELVETPVAQAAQKLVSHVFSGGYCEPIGITKILSTGHVDASRLNSPEAEKMHFLPPATILRNQLIAAAFFASAVLVPYAGVKATVAVHTWQQERADAELKQKNEAAAQKRAEVNANLLAAEKLASGKLQETRQKASVVLVGLVDKGLADSKIPATPAASIFNVESMKMWATTFWGIDTNKAPDFVEKMNLDGIWSKPVQYQTVMPHTIVLTAVVDDHGTRKVWVGLLQDTRGRGAGDPSVIQSVRNIPGVDPGKLYVPTVPGSFVPLEFREIQGAFVNSFASKGE